jgi:hypothetical protein
MKSFFLTSFVAALVVCCCMVILIAVALLARSEGEWWKVALFVVPNAIFLTWSTKEVFRTFRRARRRTVLGREATL